MTIDIRRDARRIVDQQFGQWTRRIVYFGATAAALILIAQVAQASSPNAATSAVVQRGLSTDTILSIIVGAVISVLYIRAMYLVLHYASETYHIDFDINENTQNEREISGNTLIIGALLLVIVSAIVISSYGWASLFLYIGPVICLLGPIVVIVAMEADVRKYKRVLRAEALEQRSQKSASGESSKDDQVLTP